MDRDQKISSCELFWDDGKSIAKSSEIAAYFDPGLIPEQWPDGRDHGPVLGRSKLHSETCDEPGAYVDRTTALPIRSTSPPRSVTPPTAAVEAGAGAAAPPLLMRSSPLFLLSSGVLALLHVYFFPLACSRGCSYIA